MDLSVGNLMKESSGSRKRIKTTTKKQLLKEQRNCDKDPDLTKYEPPCEHRNGRFGCCSIPVHFLLKAKKKVFLTHNKSEQDQRLALMLKVSHPKRRRRRNQESKAKPNSLVVSYHIPVGKEQVPVCAKFMRKLFGVAQTRMNNIAKCVQSGNVCQEKRGGDRKKIKFADKRAKVEAFIKELKACESHYARNKSRRLYLSSNLNITKLFKMYNSSVTDSLKVKKTFFQKIFCVKFNLGFGTPATDVCSYCLRMSHFLRLENKKDKNKILAELGAHKLRAKAFYKLMKENKTGTISFCFDLQQVQPLPKLSIGEAYYSRQISFYSFCITDIDTKNPHFYVWTEEQSGRGAVEVSSALWDFLKKFKFDISVTTVRLFADGCGGQNKNCHVIHTLSTWLYQKAPKHIKEILLVFPVRGHSYLPADRLFGTVEQKLRRMPEIIHPDNYIEIYKSVGTVRALGIDWFTRDIKSLCSSLKKIEGISNMKRILIKRCMYINRRERSTKEFITMKMEPTYRCDDESKAYKSILKRGKSFENISVPRLTKQGSRITELKMKDVNNLLKIRFGDDWKQEENLQYYINALTTDSCESEEIEECDCIEEEPGLERI